MSEAAQLAALGRIHELLEEQGIAASVTRAHADLDIAVWLKDHSRLAALLAADGWRHSPEKDEDGYTGYERGSVRLELAFLACSEDGEVYTPLREGRGTWPDAAFANDVAELFGVRARLISLPALKADKAEVHDDSIVAAKDRADLATRSRLN